jgi:hypothetical protein
MYLQKQARPLRKNRRNYPRVRGRLTTEIVQGGQERAMLGILTNLSLGGCYVETSALLLPGSQVKLTFSVERITLSMQSEVVRMDMGIGAALRFCEVSHESHASLQGMLEQLAKSEAGIERQRSADVALQVKR